MNNHSLTRRELFKELWLVGGPLAAGIFLSGCREPDRIFEQVLGPFFPDPGDPVNPIRELGNEGKSYPLSNDWDLTQVKGRSAQAEGQVVSLTGKVLSPESKPVSNASIMLWQASSTGRYNHQGDASAPGFRDPRGNVIERRLDPNFQYWGHAVTDDTGAYRFRTILPGYYPADLERGWFRPPHLHFIVQSKAVPELVTQTYFKGDAIGDNAFIQGLNAKDYILRDPKLSREEQERLVVEYKADPQEPDAIAGVFDFRLRKK